MSTYFFVIFVVHYTMFRYDVCHEEYMNLSPRLRSGTTSKDTKPIILSHTTKYRIGYNLALTKDSHIFYSRGTVY